MVDLEFGPLGMGTWAIGGPFFAGASWRQSAGAPLGYGDVDDARSDRAIHCALDHGIRFFDTADAYGTGHAENVLGAALAGRSANVVVATKFGNVIDATTRELVGTDHSPAYIRRACEASLRRLRRDRIDLYQLHLGDMPTEHADQVADTLERLCDDGLIRAYGWSTDDPERAACFAGRPHAVAAQFDMNLFQDAPAMIKICREAGFTAIIRSPLAMGFLTGKFKPTSRLAANDIRSHPPDWLPYFTPGGAPDTEWRRKLDALIGVLTSGGRTPAQGALAWIRARAPQAVPIPGMRSEAQVRDNAAALDMGPLTADQMAEIDSVLNSEPV